MNGDARLRYSDSFSRWQGEQSLAEGGILLVWMDNTTFSRYARFLLRMQGIVAPTVDQRQTAVEYCQDITFWLELAKVIADPLISMRVLGSAHPGNYERETMQRGDVLHWSAPLQCWVTRTGWGTLWVPKMSFLREEATVARGALAHPDTDPVTSAQYHAATEAVSQCKYWDAIDDLEVLRLLPGEVPCARESK